MYTTLSGREPAKVLLEKAKAEIAEMTVKPSLVVVLVGDNPASEVYVRKKLEKAAEVGAEARLEKLPADASEEELLIMVESLNKDPSTHGFIVQAPLPEHINYENIVEAIDPNKDVDGWTSSSMGRMFMGIGNPFMPATPLAVMHMLDFYSIDVS
ncbi:MAG: tetrahydrofolate dehydrogenase/cyclohydrolase catalytic domain-containing protein, partial [Candidatus Micrarchaeota archaeon]